MLSLLFQTVASSPIIKLGVVGFLFLMSWTGFGATSLATTAPPAWPVRPLPQPSDRPLPSGAAVYFVDGTKGDDCNDGSLERPWKSMGHGLERLRAGDTLCLRQGTYRELVRMKVSGTASSPITLRAYPNELVVLDGGEPEFAETPTAAWEPMPSGMAHEFRSTREYSVPAVPDKDGIEVRGYFADSMIPLRGYTEVDFHAASSGLWQVSEKFNRDSGVFFGPGVWFNPKTRRIHVRLATPELPAIEPYRGVQDPRKLTLIVALRRGTRQESGILKLENVQHVRIEDIVARGSVSTVVHLAGCRNVALDRLTVYGAPALLVESTDDLKVTNCIFRGVGSPWESRASMKYRGAGAYVVQHAYQKGRITSHNWEFAQNEITDGHDCFFMFGVKNLSFHHNYVDNFNDDGLEVGPKTADQEVYLYANLISHTMNGLALHGGNGDPYRRVVSAESGAYVFRNVFDLRQRTYTRPPRVAGEAPFQYASEVAGGHDSPVWPHLWFYHNTVINDYLPSRARRYYGIAIGAWGTSSKRRVFNNIFVQERGFPGTELKAKVDANDPLRWLENLDLELDGNLFWALDQQVPPENRFKRTAAFVASQRKYAPGLTANDIYADPKVVALSSDRMAKVDLRLQPTSPARGSGVPLPADWPDVFRRTGDERPDIGAVPFGAELGGVGVDAKRSIFSGR